MGSDTGSNPRSPVSIINNMVESSDETLESGEGSEDSVGSSLCTVVVMRYMCFLNKNHSYYCLSTYYLASSTYDDNER